MTYREHPAPAALAPWLDCAWERSGAVAPVRVLPDGCAARGEDGLAQAAAAAGYADQAHFAHDCRALAGVSPRALLH